VVSVALPTMSADLHARVADVQWVSTGYLLAMSLVLPVTGWLTDRWGGRTAWTLALSVFLAGSVGCVVAWSLPVLAVGRVVQGLGGGVLLPVGMTLLARAAGPARLARVLAVIAVPGQVAPVLGPVAGGFLAGAGTWRWVFLVNLPLCAAALLLTRWLPAGRDGAAVPPLDVRGLVFLGPGLALLVLGLTWAGTGRGGILEGAAGAALLAGFGLHALRARGPVLVDLRVLRHRSAAVASVLMLLVGLAVYGGLLLLPLSLQQLGGQSPGRVGLLLVPQGLGTLAGTLLAGRVADRVGARPLVLAGLALTAVGTVPFVLAQPAGPPLAAALLVRGLGVGLAGLPLLAAAYHGVARSRMPDVTTVTRVAQQVGGALGTAALAVLLTRVAGAVGLEAAYRTAFAAVAGATLVCLLPALLLPGRPLRDRE
jgi:EmrB/QacA subfamily drug resistance transporter